MMRSKTILAMVAFLGGVAWATSPGDVFTGHRAAILAEQVFHADGIAFGVARVPLNGNDVLDETLAMDMAVQSATVNLLQRAALKDVKWPASLSDAHREALTITLVNRLTMKITVRGLQTVWQAREGEDYVAVVALPMEEAARVPSLTYDNACDILLSDASWRDASVPLDALLALKASRETLPQALDRTPWEAILAEADFVSPDLDALPRLAGRAPVGSTVAPKDADYAAGMTAYAQGDLPRAYESFLASAEKLWTYDALNMAGNAGRRIGKNAEAVALLLHAAYLKPDSPHPWVHLAYVAWSRGDETLKECCCREAEARVVDGWTMEQLQLLRTPMSMRPPASEQAGDPVSMSAAASGSNPSADSRMEGRSFVEPASANFPL